MALVARLVTFPCRAHSREELACILREAAGFERCLRDGQAAQVRGLYRC